MLAAQVRTERCDLRRPAFTSKDIRNKHFKKWITFHPSRPDSECKSKSPALAISRRCPAGHLNIQIFVRIVPLLVSQTSSSLHTQPALRLQSSQPLSGATFDPTRLHPDSLDRGRLQSNSGRGKSIFSESVQRVHQAPPRICF